MTKSQAPNLKQARMTKIPMKPLPRSFDNWLLEFVSDLMLGAWSFPACSR
jgi:hypothetical protein